MTKNEFRLPDLGEGLQEVEIISWHVSEGDYVVNEQPLLSVETEKAVVDIPAPRSGKIRKLCAKAGETMAIGSVLVEFSNDNGAGTPDAGSVVGNLEASTPKESSWETSSTTTDSLTSDSSSTSTSSSNPTSIPDSSAAAPGNSTTAPVKAIPAARRLAQELGVDLIQIKGTGPNGTITLPDVQDAMAKKKKLQVSSHPPDDNTQVFPGTEFNAGAGYIPLRGVRKSMSNLMSQSHATVVPATLHDTADIHGWYGRENVTVRMIKGIISAFQAEPLLNAAFKANSICKNTVLNLGIAVDTAEGLFVPVLKNIENLSTHQIKSQLEELKQGARERTLEPAAFRDATLTLSNFGAIAGQYGSMVVSPPQVAIVGCGRLTDRVVLEGEKPVNHKILPLSLTIDHRAITGGEAARFMAGLIQFLEKD